MEIKFTREDGTKFAIRSRDHRESPKRRYANGRVYLSNVESKYPELEAQRAALPAPKERGEDPENDKAYDLYNRAYIKAWRIEALAALKELIERGITLRYELLKGMKFSRFAGCSCPCSPGGILSEVLLIDGQPCDLWVTLPKKEEPAEAAE